MATQWDGLGTDFNSGVWMLAYCQHPFWNAQLNKVAAELQGSAPWKALDVGCGMGQHTIKMLQAGEHANPSFQTPVHTLTLACIELPQPSCGYVPLGIKPHMANTNLRMLTLNSRDELQCYGKELGFLS
jgi:tRNA G46 methylase TrmB